MEKVPRKGTSKLLQLLKKLDEKDRNEVLTYIGNLEKREDELFKKITVFCLDFTGSDGIVKKEYIG